MEPLAQLQTVITQFESALKQKSADTNGLVGYQQTADSAHNWRRPGQHGTGGGSTIETGEPPVLSRWFSAAIVAAGSCARLETLKAAIAVFYRDCKSNLEVREQPDGRKFEVCLIDGAPREGNCPVIRALGRQAA